MTQKVVNIQRKTIMFESEFSAYLLHAPNCVQHFEKIGEQVYYPSKSIIVGPGQATEYCYMIKKGRVVSYEILENGEECIYQIHGKGAIFLEGNVLLKRTSPIGYRTEMASELLRFRKKDLLSAFKESPEISLRLIESFAVKYEASVEQIRQERNKNATWRVCNLFLSMAEQIGIDLGDRIVIPEKISQQTILSMLGMNRITVVRIIKRLKEEGLLEQNERKYSICDAERLLEYQKRSSNTEIQNEWWKS